jgi:hypothetical protein
MRGTTEVRCGLQEQNRFCPSGCSCTPLGARYADPIPIQILNTEAQRFEDTLT